MTENARELLEIKIGLAIRLAVQVCKQPSFLKWAEAWLDGSDRTRKSAYAAAAAAYAAADAADAAYAATYAADAAAYAAADAAAYAATDAAAAFGRAIRAGARLSDLDLMTVNLLWREVRVYLKDKAA